MVEVYDMVSEVKMPTLFQARLQLVVNRIVSEACLGGATQLQPERAWGKYATALLFLNPDRWNQAEVERRLQPVEQEFPDADIRPTPEDGPFHVNIALNSGRTLPLVMPDLLKGRYLPLADEEIQAVAQWAKVITSRMEDEDPDWTSVLRVVALQAHRYTDVLDAIIGDKQPQGCLPAIGIKRAR